MRQFFAHITSLAAIVLLFTAAAYSQFMRQEMLKAEVPFEFIVEKKTFPPGEYLVVRVAPHTLSLRDANNRILATFVTAEAFSTAVHSNPALRFEAVGNRHVLTQIWPGGTTTGYQLSTSNRAFSLARQLPSAREVQATASTPLRK